MKVAVAACRLVGVCALIVTATWPVLAADYAVRLFDRPGALSTQLWDINDGGVIVGAAAYTDGRSAGFTYSAGVFTDFAGPAGALRTQFTGISNSGLIVGFFDSADSLEGRGVTSSFLFNGSNYTSFAIPGTDETVLRHISSDGRYLTGTYTIDAVHYGFAYDRWTDGFMSFGERSIAQGASIDGVVVGSATLGNASQTGFEHDLATGVTSFPMIDGLEQTRFRDINDVGSITGFTRGDGNLAFVLSAAGELSTFTFAGAYDTAGYGLNNHNVLVGWYGDYDGQILRGFVATPVPEPQSWALLLCGLAFVGWARAAASTAAASTRVSVG